MTKTPDFIDRSLPRHETEILISELLNVDRSKLFLGWPKLNWLQKRKLNHWQKQLRRGYPLQYLLGKAYFLDLELFVNKNVLIPRPETELLVEQVIRNIKSRIKNDGQKKINILEIGVGSGCIIISIDRFLSNLQDINYSLTACDISAKALAVARKNSQKYNTKIKFILSDLFQNIEDEKFDLIIANLPYVKESQLEKVKFEPRLAIFGGQDGFELIERLAGEAKKFLNPSGQLFLEYDPSQNKLLEKSAQKHGFKLKIAKDLNDRDRIGILN